MNRIAPYYPKTAEPPEAPTDLGHIIATGVSTSVNTAVAAASAIAPEVVKRSSGDFHVEGSNGATVDSVGGTIVARGPNGATSTVYPPDAQGRRKIVAALRTARSLSATPTRATGRTGMIGQSTASSK